MSNNSSWRPRRGGKQAAAVGDSMPIRTKFAIIGTVLVLTLAMAAALTAFFLTANRRAAGNLGGGGPAGGPATPPTAAGPVVTPAQGPSPPVSASPSSSLPTPTPSSTIPTPDVLPALATIAISGTGRDLERTVTVRVTRQPQAGHRLWLVAQFPDEKGPPLQSPWVRLAAHSSTYSISRSFKKLSSHTKRTLFIVDTTAAADRLMTDYLKQDDKFKGLPSGALQVSKSVDATKQGGTP